MITAIFRRFLNLMGAYIPTLRLAMDTACTHAKKGRPAFLSRCGDAFYFVAKQTVRMIGTMYPPPPREEHKMTSRYIRWPLLAFVVALVSPLLTGPAVAQTDYDSENNRLIDITTLAQLNAMRWDLDGNGVADRNADNYNAAFPNAATGMGCPSTGCRGYELKANLDFDTDNDGDVDGDDPGSYENWWPIGEIYNTTFRGNGFTINNLRLVRASNDHVGLFNIIGLSGRVESLGLTNANVVGQDHVGILAHENRGTIIACYTTGRVQGRTQVGGLVGNLGQGVFSGTAPVAYITASYSTAEVSATGTGPLEGISGGLVGMNWGGFINASYATGSVSSGRG